MDDFEIRHNQVCYLRVDVKLEEAFCGCLVSKANSGYVHSTQREHVQKVNLEQVVNFVQVHKFNLIDFHGREALECEGDPLLKAQLSVHRVFLAICEEHSVDRQSLFQDTVNILGHLALDNDIIGDGVFQLEVARVIF